MKPLTCLDVGNAVGRYRLEGVEVAAARAPICFDGWRTGMILDNDDVCQ